MISSAALPNVALRNPPRRSRPARQVLGRAADEARRGDERDGGGHEHPDPDSGLIPPQPAPG